MPPIGRHYPANSQVLEAEPLQVMRAIKSARFQLAQACHRQANLQQQAKSLRSAYSSAPPAASLAPLQANIMRHQQSLSTAIEPPATERTTAPLADTAEAPVQGSTYLSELHIRNFALVAKQRIALQPGLTVITGESGSGKSVLVSALGQILGAAAPENCIRQPAKSAVVEGHLHMSPKSAAYLARLMKDQGVPQKALPLLQPAGTKLLLRREILQGDKDGSVRSRCFVNGAAVSQRVLREICTAVVDVNGQHAAQSLKDPATQIQLLDRLAGTSRAAAAFGQQLAHLNAAEAELKALDALGDEAARDDLQGLVDKIEGHRLRPGEERELRQQLRQMEARRANVERCGLVRTTMVGDGGSGGVDDMMRAIESHLRAVVDQEQVHSTAGSGTEDVENAEYEGASAANELMEEALEQLQTARRCISAAERQVGQYARRFQFSQQEYGSVRDRLAALNRLLREVRCTSTEQLLAIADKASTDLQHWYNFQGSREQKVAAVESLQAAVAAEGAALSRQRREAAGKLRGAVEGCLADLAMSGGRFDIRIGWEQHPEGMMVSEALAEPLFEEGGRRYRANPDGLDRVEFLLAAGQAEPLRPLSAVASGGERSRIMLALKAAPAAIQSAAPSTQSVRDGAGSLQSNGKDPGDAAQEGQASSLILDELDSGVGGRLGMPVGRLLQRMVSSGAQGPSQIHQVLCVSHLPQVAASATHHICVRKQTMEDGRVTTEFVSLTDAAERCTEIAAMGGVSIEEAQIMMDVAAIQTSHH